LLNPFSLYDLVRTGGLGGNGGEEDDVGEVNTDSESAASENVAAMKRSRRREV